MVGDGARDKEGDSNDGDVRGGRTKMKREKF